METQVSTTPVPKINSGVSFWWKFGFFVELGLLLLATGLSLSILKNKNTNTRTVQEKTAAVPTLATTLAPKVEVSSTFVEKPVTNHIILSYPDNWFYTAIENGAFVSSISEECPQCSQAELDNSFYFKITDEGPLPKWASENAQYFKLKEWIDWLDSENKYCSKYPKGNCLPPTPGYVEYFISLADQLFPSKTISAVEINDFPRTGLNKDISSERIYFLISNRRMLKVDVIYPKRFDINGKLEEWPSPLDTIVKKLKLN